MIDNDADWFPEVPSEWRRVGVLSFDLPTVIAATGQVTLFATSDADVARLEQELLLFRGTLPPHASLVIGSAEQ